MSEDLIKPINVAEELSQSFLEYSMSVIVSRALPDVRDGLKPSQRRVLYAMRQLGVTPTKAHVKCAFGQHGSALVDARHARRRPR